MAGAEHVEGAEQVDIDHGLERIGRHPQHRREEIPRRARDHDVERAELIARLFERAADRAEIAHVGAEADRIVADLGGGIRGFLRIAPDHRDLCAEFGVALGDTQIDAAGAAGDEGDFAFEQAILER